MPKRDDLKGLTDRTAYALLLLILIAGIALSMLFYSGPYLSFDDGNYIAFARQLVSGKLQITESPYAFGYLTPLLIAVSFEIFGASAAVAALPTFASYLFMIVITFMIGSRFFNRKTGVMAGFLIATFPFVLGYTTRAIPDMLLGAIAGLAIYLLFLGSENGVHHRGTLFASGAAAGLMVFVKLGGLGFGIFLVLAVLLTRRRAAPWLLLGLAASVAIYLLSFYILAAGNIGALHEYVTMQNSMSKTYLALNALTFAAVLVGGASTHQIYFMGTVTALLVVGTFKAVKERNANLACLAFVFWSVFLYMFFGTESLARYVLITVVDRYFILIAVPLALVSAYPLTDLYAALAKNVNKKVALAVLLIALALVILPSIHSYQVAYGYNVLIRSAG